LVPRIVKNKPAKEIERERKWGELRDQLKAEPTVKPDIQAALALELAKAADQDKAAELAMAAEAAKQALATKKKP
jgi:hypothetical protein